MISKSKTESKGGGDGGTKAKLVIKSEPSLSELITFERETSMAV